MPKIMNGLTQAPTGTRSHHHRRLWNREQPGRQTGQAHHARQTHVERDIGQGIRSHGNSFVSNDHYLSHSRFQQCIS